MQIEAGQLQIEAGQLQTQPKWLGPDSGSVTLDDEIVVDASTNTATIDPTIRTEPFILDAELFAKY